MTISFSPEETWLLTKTCVQALSYGCCKHQDLNMSSNLLHFLRRNTVSWRQDRGDWCLPPHSRVWSHHSILFSKELTICTWCNADWLRNSLNVSWEGGGERRQKYIQQRDRQNKGSRVTSDPTLLSSAHWALGWGSSSTICISKVSDIHRFQ